MSIVHWFVGSSVLRYMVATRAKKQGAQGSDLQALIHPPRQTVLEISQPDDEVDLILRGDRSSSRMCRHQDRVNLAHKIR
jgi:hypothetical protein